MKTIALTLLGIAGAVVLALIMAVVIFAIYDYFVWRRTRGKNS